MSSLRATMTDMIQASQRGLDPRNPRVIAEDSLIQGISYSLGDHDVKPTGWGSIGRRPEPVHLTSTAAPPRHIMPEEAHHGLRHEVLARGAKRAVPQIGSGATMRQNLHDVVEVMRPELLDRAVEVAVAIPYLSPERFDRVELALDPWRAAQVIMQASLITVPKTAQEPVLWIEPHAALVRAPPEMLKGAKEELSEAERAERLQLIAQMIWRDFCKARAEVHRQHAEMMIPHVQQAEEVARRIPDHAKDRKAHPGSIHPGRRYEMAMQTAERFWHAHNNALKGESGAWQSHRDGPRSHPNMIMSQLR